MKTIFNLSEQQDVRARLEKLTPETKALWGKMNVSQMLAHCTGAMQIPVGDLKVKPLGFPINLIGRLIKKTILAEDKPIRKNSPTAAEIKMTSPKEFHAEKEKFLQALDKISKGESAIKLDRHHVFGKMEPHEWGKLNYKHTDHHFKQFGV